MSEIRTFGLENRTRKSSDFRQKKVSEILTFLFGFQTLSEIQTFWKRDVTELSEIQTSSDFRQFSCVPFPDSLDFRQFFLSGIRTLKI